MNSVWLKHVSKFFSSNFRVICIIWVLVRIEVFNLIQIAFNPYLKHFGVVVERQLWTKNPQSHFYFWIRNSDDVIHRRQFSTLWLSETTGVALFIVWPALWDQPFQSSHRKISILYKFSHLSRFPVRKKPTVLRIEIFFVSQPSERLISVDLSPNIHELLNQIQASNQIMTLTESSLVNAYVCFV